MCDVPDSSCLWAKTQNGKQRARNHTYLHKCTGTDPIAFFMQKLVGLFQKQSTKPMNLIFCNLFAIKTEQRLYSSEYN